jgi:hypothetical protein
MTSRRGGDSSIVVPHAAVTSRTTAVVAVVRLRSAFSITSRRNIGGSEIHMITAPKHGPDRAQARQAIITVLRRADKHGHRVSFLITLGDYNQHMLHPHDGYDPNHVLIECRVFEDPYTWLQRQLRTVSSTGDTNSIIGVTISTWPRAVSEGS